MVYNGDAPAAAELLSPRLQGGRESRTVKAVARHTGLASGVPSAREARKREREEPIGRVLSRENTMWGADGVNLHGRRNGGGR